MCIVTALDFNGNTVGFKLPITTGVVAGSVARIKVSPTTVATAWSERGVCGEVNTCGETVSKVGSSIDSETPPGASVNTSAGMTVAMTLEIGLGNAGKNWKVDLIPWAILIRSKPSPPTVSWPDVPMNVTVATTTMVLVASVDPGVVSWAVIVKLPGVDPGVNVVVGPVVGASVPTGEVVVAHEIL